MFPLITTFAPLFYKNKKWNYTRSKPVSNLSFLRIIFFNSIRKSRYVLKETLFPPTLYSPSLSQCGLAWVPPPRSTPATCPCNNLLGRPASSQTFLQGSCLLWELEELTWPWNRSQPPTEPISSGRRLCDSAIASVFSVCLLFPWHRADKWRCGDGALHLCLSSEACVDGVCKW